ncbi:MAG: hypothetical protein KDB23_14950 [Planctomycetales bacterium]|nr:hypothetical protein [Planctomycetales bacterium]
MKCYYWSSLLIALSVAPMSFAQTGTPGTSPTPQATAESENAASDLAKTESSTSADAKSVNVQNSTKSANVEQPAPTTNTSDRSATNSSADATNQKQSNRWRYRRHNGEWWYWTKNDNWVYWRDNRWNRFDESTFSPLTYDSGAQRMSDQDLIYQGPTPRYQSRSYDNRFYYRNGFNSSPYGDNNNYYPYGSRYNLVGPYGYGGQPYGAGYGTPYYGNQGGRVGAGIGSAIGGAIGGQEGAYIGQNIGGAIGSRN